MEINIKISLSSNKKNIISYKELNLIKKNSRKLDISKTLNSLLNFINIKFARVILFNKV